VPTRCSACAAGPLAGARRLRGSNSFWYLGLVVVVPSDAAPFVSFRVVSYRVVTPPERKGAGKETRTGSFIMKI
jgi:hypothetical protein